MKRAVAGSQSRPDVDTSWAEAQIGYLLRRATAAMTADFNESASPDDLRPVLVTMLTVIDSTPGVTSTALGTALGIQRANVAPLVAELVDLELVERKRSETDRRQVGLHLRSAGWEAMKRGQRLVEAHESRMAAPLSPSERSMLLALLSRIVHGSDRG